MVPSKFVFLGWAQDFRGLGVQWFRLSGFRRLEISV